MLLLEFKWLTEAFCLRIREFILLWVNQIRLKYSIEESDFCLILKDAYILSIISNLSKLKSIQIIS